MGVRNGQPQGAGARRQPTPAVSGALVTQQATGANPGQVLPAPPLSSGPPDLTIEVRPSNIWSMTDSELAAVQDFCVVKGEVGEVTWHGKTDCRSILGQLEELVQLAVGEVVVYPDPAKKPPIGHGLNKPATILLFGCMPRSQGKLRDPAARERYKKKVAQMTEEKGATFLDYDCDKGTWKFYVSHF